LKTSRKGAPADQGRERREGRRLAQGFSLLEAIGVLAIIGIFAALLIPKVFEALFSANIAQTAATLNTQKAASAQHFANYGALAVDGSTSPSTVITLGGSDPRALEFDLVLLREALIDSRFRVKIGDRIEDATHTRVQLLPTVSSSTDVDADNGAYDLDGSGAPNDVTGTVVVEAVITGVGLAEARALNAIMDGTLAAFGENPAGHDHAGRVKYQRPAANNGNGNNGKGNGNGGGNGNGNNGNGNGNGGSNNNGASAANTVNVHVYLTHR
jgi:type II secretory pathway pseudopilin PulG